MNINELKARCDTLYTVIMEKKDELEKLADEYEFMQCKIKDEVKRLESLRNEKEEPAPEPEPEPDHEPDHEPEEGPDTLPPRYKECKNMTEMLKLLETEMKQLEETAKVDFKMDDLEDNEAIMKRMAEARASLNSLRGSKSE